MSSNAISWALTADHTLSPTEQLVLVVIAHHFSEKTQNCWPSHRLLARETKLSLSSVNRALSRLQILGLIELSTGGQGYSNRYTLPRYTQGGVPTVEGGVPTVGIGVPTANTEQKGTEKEPKAGKEASGVNPHAKGSQMKVSQIVAKAKAKYEDMTEQTILAVKKVNGRHTAQGLGDCWRNAHGKWASGHTLGALTIKDAAQLLGAAKRAAVPLPPVIVAAMKDWGGYVSHVKHAAGVTTVPTAPSIAFFVKHVEHAVTFAGKHDAPAPVGKPVQLIAKPAPKPAAPPAKPAPALTTTKVTMNDLEDVLSDLGGPHDDA